LLSLKRRKERKKNSHPLSRGKGISAPQSNNHQIYKKARYHIPNRLALLGCALTTTSTSASLSFPLPFPLLLAPPGLSLTKDEGEYWWWDEA
jgi:hypothetical protein